MKFALYAAVLMAISVPAMAGGPIIYNNGGPNQQNGNEMSNWLQAEDFILGQGLNVITDVHFWTIEAPGMGFNGKLDYSFYQDAGGAPGAFVVGGPAVGTTHVFTGNVVLGYYNEFEMEFNLQAPLALTAGARYWLGLHANGSYNNRDEIYWESTNYNGTFTGHEDYQGLGSWADNGVEHAFYLTGVPEPGVTALLGGLVLTGFGLIRRRK